MSVDIRLYINNTLADISDPKDIVVKIYKRLFDINNIDEKGGDYTLGFKLPRTTTNSKLFNYIDVIDISQGFKNLRPLDCQLISGNETVLTGKIVVDKITPKEFDVTIYGDNISWATIIGDKSLRDLSSFREVRFSGTHGLSPQTSWLGQQPNTVSFWDIWNDDGTLYDIQFPLICYGNFPMYSANVGGFTNDTSATKYPQLATWDRRNALNWDEFTPAVYETKIVEAIIREAGYDPYGSYFTDDFCKSLIVLFTGFPDEDNESIGENTLWNWGIIGRINLTAIPDFCLAGDLNIVNPGASVFYMENIQECYYANVQPTITSIPIAPTYFLERYSHTMLFRNLVDTVDDSNNFDAYQYYIPKTGQYRIRFTIDWYTIRIANANPGLHTVSLIVYKHRGLTLIDEEEFPNGLWYNNGNIRTGDPSEYDDNVIYQENYYQNPVAITLDTHNIVSVDFTATIEQGYKIGICVAVQDLGSLVQPLIVGVQDYIIEPLFDYTINPANFLPDINQLDFIKNLLSTRNIWLDIDEQKKSFGVFLFPDYFYPSNTAIDWSDKCNLINASIEPSTGYKKVTFGYTLDDDDVMQPKAVDDLVLPFTVDLNTEYYTEEKEIKSLFSSTAMRKVVVGHFQSGTIIELPMSYIATEATYVAKPIELDFTITTGDKIVRQSKFSPRILIWAGLKTTPTPPSHFFTVGGRGSSNIDYSDIYTSGFIGKMIFPVAYFTADGIGTLRYENYTNNIGIYQKYFEEYINRSLTSIKVTLPVYLTGADIRMANPRRLIKIGTILFIMNLIDGFDPVVEGETDVELIKLN